MRTFSHLPKLPMENKMNARELSKKQAWNNFKSSCHDIIRRVGIACNEAGLYPTEISWLRWCVTDPDNEFSGRVISSGENKPCKNVIESNYDEGITIIFWGANHLGEMQIHCFFDGKSIKIGDVCPLK